ncbi:cytochrome c oxidase assembly protein COX15 homolog [Zophobas morio]|uniref:cytochrome c oxidase assembly protein COX15 homolog n=1 Tax=Zophobas morio TaxID=2755281 RepID=UPI003082D5A5
MLSLARQCRSAMFLPQTKQLLGVTTRSLPRNGVVRTYMNPVWRRQPLANVIKNANFFKSCGSVIVRLSSNIPQKGKKGIGYWLVSCSGMIFVAVVLGGVTRLTESGLSMVTWKLLGEKMPTNEKEWEEEFKKYQQYPEFKIKNKEMTLSEFKWIWYMEFGHRMWGRAIGAVFLLPAVYFWSRGMFTPAMKKRVVAFGALIGAQGLMGWYMVKSGLEDRFHGESDVPRVSQYRLAAHLSLAFVLYTLFLWSGLDHLLPAETITNASKNAIKASRKFRMVAHTCKGLVFLTAVSGAFVAGLDAGLVYNSFPKMADKWIPDDLLALNPNIVNVTENPTTVQFDHRILGTVTVSVISALYLMSRKRILPRRAYTAAAVLGAVAWLQVALGITTLLTYVPTALAASHQSGSLLLLSSAVWLTHELKRLPK